ncbi:MAG: hypothetical protein D6706_09115 [Chloroflexi bacterium]|nr:MAG: hypothetical protein D6706_09115 [Chloroflexota bacterium]
MKTYKKIVVYLLLFGTFIIQTGTSQANPTAPNALTFINPGTSDVVLAELDEFATVVMGDPWDMNEPTDLSHYRAESNLSNSTFSGGVYSAQMNGSNDGAERITLLSAGAQNNQALRIGKIGYNFPIDANKYRYLTYRLYKSHSNKNTGLIRWYEDDTRTSSVMGVSTPFDIPAGAGWHTIVVDLKTIGLQQGSKNWEGTIRELIIHPFEGAGAQNATVKLDWARLTADDPLTARPFTIQWSGGSGTITLYASPDDKTLDTTNDILIGTANASDGSYTFQTGVLPAGTYYIAADTDSGVVWSNGALVINTPPQIEFISPSMESGTEYSASVIGNAWDMSDVQDINYNMQPWETSCVTNEQFSGGIYSADLYQCPSGVTYVDPVLYIGGMNPYPPGTQDPVIDTSKYRYLSFRFYHSGTQNVQEGWVARFGWWTVNGTDGQVTEDVVMSRDIVLLEGWNTYHVDLWASDIIDEAHPVKRSWLDSAPNRLRLDPSELNVSLLPATIQLDWIKLTAINEIKQGDIFPIKYEVASSRPVTVTFYYDSDTNPNNGRSLINTINIANSVAQNNNVVTPQAMTYFLYLPMILNNACVGCVTWETASVSLGTYYVCADLWDGYNTIYRCSDAPVYIR